MQECKGADKKLMELIWVDTDKSVNPARKTFRSRLCVWEYMTKKQGKIQRALLASQLFSALPPLEAVNALVLVEQREPLKLRQYDISRAHFQGAAQRLIYTSSCWRSSELWKRQSWQMIESMYGTQDACHIWELDYVTLICGEL